MGHAKEALRWRGQRKKKGREGKGKELFRQLALASRRRRQDGDQEQ
jgi:hypothetical protein